MNQWVQAMDSLSAARACTYRANARQKNSRAGIFRWFRNQTRHCFQELVKSALKDLLVE